MEGFKCPKNSESKEPKINGGQHSIPLNSELTDTTKNWGSRTSIDRTTRLGF
jgi:hypothetical protein